MIIYGDNKPKPAGTWDYSLNVTDCMNVELNGSEYSVKIFQWAPKKSKPGETRAGSVAFRCRGYLGDPTAVDTAEIFVRALNDGYPTEKVFKGKKSGSFLRSNDLPRYLPAQYVEWKMASENSTMAQPSA